MVLNPLVQYSPVMLKDLLGLIVATILLFGAAWVSWQRIYEVLIMVVHHLCNGCIGLHFLKCVDLIFGGPKFD